MIFNGFVKGKEKPTGGHYWNNAGFTLFESEYEGKQQFSMTDNRTGARISFFPMEKRNKGEATNSTQSNDEPF